MSDLSETRPFAIPLPRGLVEFVAEREIELQENAEGIISSPTNPQQFSFQIITQIIKANYKNLPRRLLKDVIWLLPLSLIWLYVWTEWVPGAFSSLLIFLTAGYNGFFGKAAFITIISRTYRPLIEKYRSGEKPLIMDKYRQTAGLIRNAFEKSKMQFLQLFFIFGGLGLIISNILTRNNKIDKYLVCLLLAFALFDDLSKGLKNPVVKLFMAIVNDFCMMFGKKIDFSRQFSYISISSFAAGIALAFVPGFFVNSFISPVGAIFGAVFVVIGIILKIVEGKNAATE